MTAPKTVVLPLHHTPIKVPENVLEPLRISPQVPWTCAFTNFAIRVFCATTFHNGLRSTNMNKSTLLVELVRFELTTLCLQSRCSNQAELQPQVCVIRTRMTFRVYSGVSSTSKYSLCGSGRT